MSTVRAPERLLWVDIAKALAMVAVVAYHAAIFLVAADVIPDAVVHWSARLVTFPMPLFFLASGLFAGAAVHQPWSVLTRRKILPVAYVYVVWVVLRFLWFQVVPDVRGSTDGAGLQDLLRSLVLPDSGMWFVYALAVSFAAARATRRAPVVLQLLGAAALSVLMGAGLLPVDNIAWKAIALLYVFFLVGIHLGSPVLRWAATTSTTRTAALAVATVSLVGGIQTAAVAELPGAHLLSSVLTTASAVSGSVLLSRTPLGPRLAALGRATLPVYLLHVLVVSGLVAVVDRGPAPSTGVGLMVFAAVTAAGVFVSLGASRQLVPRAPWLFSAPGLPRDAERAATPPDARVRRSTARAPSVPDQDRGGAARTSRDADAT